MPNLLPKKLIVKPERVIFNPSAPNERVRMYRVDDEKGVTHFSVGIDDSPDFEAFIAELSERLNSSPS